jgi:hypothetical protein
VWCWIVDRPAEGTGSRDIKAGAFGWAVNEVVSSRNIVCVRNRRSILVAAIEGDLSRHSAADD